MQVEVFERGRSPRSVTQPGAARWPRPAPPWESWAAGLARYPAATDAAMPKRAGATHWIGGLERMAERHESAALAMGWRRVAGEWVPPRGRTRLSVPEATRRVRRFAMAAVRNSRPLSLRGGKQKDRAYKTALLDHTADVLGVQPETAPRGLSEQDLAALRENICRALTYSYEVFTWLLVCDTTEEVAAKLLDPEAITVSTRGRRQDDPLRERFRSVGSLLDIADASVGCLGDGAPNFQVAESKGRTRARWNEVACSPSHVSSASVRGLGALERRLDAQRALTGLSLTEDLDVHAALRDGLQAWLADGAKREERVRVFRHRLARSRWRSRTGLAESRALVCLADDDADETALATGADIDELVASPDRHRDRPAWEVLWAVAEVAWTASVTADWTDRAILAALSRARDSLERHLSKAPARSEEIAFLTGEKSFLAPLVKLESRDADRQRRKPRERPAPALASEAL